MAKLNVEVVFAAVKAQKLIDLQCEPGTTVLSAIQTSGILEAFPEINLEHNKVGIFGEVCALETLIKEGDRIEIYRPLQIDPKNARRLRAKRTRSTN